MTVAESQSDACMGILPYGVEGEIAASLEISNELMMRLSERNTRNQKIQIFTSVLTRPRPSL